jgi:1-pyrroline-5-carboxylate dehydrogenase
MDLHAQQPAVQPPGSWNRLEYRPLEGFVYAISPFNFTALGANLVGAPALMGNVVIWKPSLSALHSSWLLHKILLEAGLPENVIQFVPGDAEEITSTVLSHRHFAALNFTGSTSVFKSLLGQIGQGTAEDRYLSYPRVVGETGGKNFHLVHSSADIRNAVTNTIRSSFEYQGQKCSAASRIYVSESIWPAFKNSLIQETEKLKVGNPEQYSHFINPVIHARSYDKLASVIESAKSDPELTLLTGGTASNETGYFIHPTIYQTSNPHHPLMTTELFWPLIAVYVYPDAQFPSIPALINSTSTYALTGSIFARDQKAIRFASDELRHSAGNFYINTKSSGSVVAQQPFGGSRGSGTNDKVGSVNNLMRFTSIRAIKEDFVGATEVQYPSNEV